MSLEKFESDLIKKFSVNSNLFIKISKRLRPEHFRNSALKWSYEVMLNHFSKYNEVPALKVLESELMKTPFSEEKKMMFLKTIKKSIHIKKAISSKYIEDKIEEKIGKQEFLLAVDQALKDIDSISLEEAKKKLLEKFLLGGSYSQESKEIMILKGWKLRQETREALSKMPREKRFIMTPFSEINAVTHGIQAGEAATIAGSTGMGKSILAHEFGFSALMDGIRVVHFTIENTAEQTAQRYDSRITKIKYDTIKLYGFSPEEMKYFNEVFEGISGALENDVVVKETFRDFTDMIWIDKEIKTLEARGFSPGFVIIDSCDIMKSVKSYKEYRLDRASIYWNFKDWCKMRGLPGLTTTQARKEMKLRKWARYEIDPGTEDLAESYDKSRILDIVYILYNKQEDEEDSIMRFRVAKNRDGPVGAEVTLFKDSERMRFVEIRK